MDQNERWTRCVLRAVISVFVVAGTTSSLAAEPKRPVDGIYDNSFLVEEAYNQEVGVVQHIYSAYYNVTRHRGPDDHNWDTAFTQEWPVFSRTHQFSYTVPFTFLDLGGHHDNGVGDVLLNYRWQAFFRELGNPEWSAEAAYSVSSRFRRKNRISDPTGSRRTNSSASSVASTSVADQSGALRLDADSRTKPSSTKDHLISTMSPARCTCMGGERKLAITRATVLVTVNPERSWATTRI